MIVLFSKFFPGKIKFLFSLFIKKQIFIFYKLLQKFPKKLKVNIISSLHCRLCIVPADPVYGAITRDLDYDRSPLAYKEMCILNWAQGTL